MCLQLNELLTLAVCLGTTKAEQALQSIHTEHVARLKKLFVTALALAKNRQPYIYLRGCVICKKWQVMILALATDMTKVSCVLSLYRRGGEKELDAEV